MVEKLPKEVDSSNVFVYLSNEAIIFTGPDGRGQNGRIPPGATITALCSLSDMQDKSPKRKAKLIGVTVAGMDIAGEATHFYIPPRPGYPNGGLSVGAFVIITGETYYVYKETAIPIQKDKTAGEEKQRKVWWLYD